VYARCFETLPKAGVLVNGDFIMPDGTAWDYEAGRFEIAALMKPSVPDHIA
jgi:hypothetical protein